MDEPENIMLNEISLSQKGKYGVIPLTWGAWSSQNHRHKKQSDGFQAQGRMGNEELFCIRCRVLILALQDEKSPEIDCTTVWIYYT